MEHLEGITRQLAELFVKHALELVSPKLKQLARTVAEESQLQILTNYYRDKLLCCTEPGVSHERIADCEVIISLTSYGTRINQVAMAIESCMQQTVKANKIILWLDESFRGKPLPATLRKQQERGLMIDYCEDIRSYKKIIPTLKRYPKAAIITVDDDLIYDCNLVDRLLRSWKEHPHCVHCSRMHRMVYDEQGELIPYAKWGWECRDVGEPDMLNFMTSGAGTLFPPGSLAPEVMNQEVFMELCPTADDVWLNAMARLAGSSVVRAYTGDNGCGYIESREGQAIALWHQNLTRGGNDIQIKAVFSRYGIDDIIKKTPEPAASARPIPQKRTVKPASRRRKSTKEGETKRATSQSRKKTNRD